MLSINVRALLFSMLAVASYSAFKTSDALRGCVADGRAEDCLIITAAFALVCTFTVRRPAAVATSAAAWATALLIGTTMANAFRWPPPLMMLLALASAAACGMAATWWLRRSTR